VLRAVTEDYLRRSGLDIKAGSWSGQRLDGLVPGCVHARAALMPAYAKNVLPWSVVSRPLEGEPPTIDLAVGYSKANTSPILKLSSPGLRNCERPRDEDLRIRRRGGRRPHRREARSLGNDVRW